MGFDDDMDGYENEEWTPRTGGDFGPLMPDGQHQALLVQMGTMQRQSDEHWQVFMRFRNRTGTVTAWRDIDAENGFDRETLRGDLIYLGWEEKTFKGLQAACDSGRFNDIVCTINKKTKPGDTRDFVNVYLNGVAGKAEDPSMFDVDPSIAGAQQATSSAAATFGADDGIPF